MGILGNGKAKWKCSRCGKIIEEKDVCMYYERDGKTAHLGHTTTSSPPYLACGPVYKNNKEVNIISMKNKKEESL